MIKILSLALLSVLILGGCSDSKEARDKKAPAMKCGSGKCGANMFDGNSALAKKKKNMLSQMRDDDTRKDCVLSAVSTKALYNCVRDAHTGKLSTKCGVSEVESGKEAVMKCGADMDMSKPSLDSKE